MLKYASVLACLIILSGCGGETAPAKEARDDAHAARVAAKVPLKAPPALSAANAAALANCTASSDVKDTCFVRFAGGGLEKIGGCYEGSCSAGTIDYDLLSAISKDPNQVGTIVEIIPSGTDRASKAETEWQSHV